MTGPDARQECVHNSVDWYGSIARAHGLDSAIEDGVWTCRSAMPPYYSNAVTASRAAVGDQLAHIHELVDAVPPPFTVKDGYTALDLAPFGFRVLFDAQWIRLAHDAAGPAGERADRWHRLTAPDDLERWEDAWRAHGSPATRRVFVPALLADESVAILAARHDGEIAAGVVANRSTAVVGLSNFFAAGPDVDAQFAGAVAAVRAAFPGAPVVGYESGEALERALREGFRPVGPLRIWLREP
jgi:hypothetical protein